ncbi:MAG: hypothetical protein ACFFD4_31155 [Candidatus Odinarchaeota archaeon]
MIRFSAIIFFLLFILNLKVNKSKSKLQKAVIILFGYLFGFPDPNLVYPIIYETELTLSSLFLSVAFIIPTQIIFLPFSLFRDGLNLLNGMLLSLSNTLETGISSSSAVYMSDVGFVVMIFCAPIIPAIILRVSINKRNEDQAVNDYEEGRNNSDSEKKVLPIAINQIDEFQRSRSHLVAFFLIALVITISMVIKFPFELISRIGDAPTYINIFTTKNPASVSFELLWWLFAILSGALLLSEIFNPVFAYFYLVSLGMVLIGFELDYILKSALKSSSYKDSLEIRAFFVVFWQLTVIFAATIAGHFRVLVSLIFLFGLVVLFIMIENKSNQHRIPPTVFFLLLVSFAGVLLFSHRLTLLVFAAVLTTEAITWKEFSLTSSFVRFTGLVIGLGIFFNVSALFNSEIPIQGIVPPGAWLGIVIVGVYLFILYRDVILRRNSSIDGKNLLVIGVIALATFIALLPVMKSIVNTRFLIVDLFVGLSPTGILAFFVTAVFMGVYFLVLCWRVFHKRKSSFDKGNLTVLGIIAIVFVVVVLSILTVMIDTRDIFIMTNLYTGAGFQNYIDIYEHIWLSHTVRPPWGRLPTTFHMLAFLGFFFCQYERKSVIFVGLFSFTAYYFSLNFVNIGFLPNRFYELAVPGLLIFGAMFIKEIDLGKKMKLCLVALLAFIFLQFLFVFYVSNNLFNFELLKELLKKIIEI